jgi:hypothetical protein
MTERSHNQANTNFAVEDRNNIATFLSPNPAGAPFFIVGYARSGTTLLSVLLDRHSRIAVPPETNFFTAVCNVDRATFPSDAAALIDRFVNGFRTRDLNLAQSDLLRQFNGMPPNHANLLLTALKLYGKTRGKEIVGEKTPEHWRFIPQILELFPSSRVIWIVRDGKDTVLSLTKTPWRPHWDLEYHAWHWRISTECMLDFESLARDRMLRVKFENLVVASKSELARTCRFLGIEFEPRQLDTTVQTDVVPSWELPWKCRALTPPDPERIGVARRELTKAQLDLMNDVMRPTMERLGYAPD